MGGIASGIGGAIGGIVSPLENALGIENHNSAGTTNLPSPVTPEQMQAAYMQNRDAVMTQQAFVQALQSQGTQGMNTQLGLTGTLQDEAAGRGPNPAQAQLANATGANVANQAALMAGQRGAGSNPALIARQAAMQGANTQQQAAGQAAVLGAQQQLAAQNQLQNLAGSQINQVGSAQNSYSNAAQNNLNSLYGANGQNQALQAGMFNNANNINAGVAAGNQQANNQFLGNVMGAVGSAAGMAGGGGKGPVAKYNGGQIQKLADGGQVKPSSRVGGFLHGSMPSASVQAPAMMASGGKVPALLSPGEGYLPPEKAQAVAERRANPIKESQVVPGQAKVKGDSPKNDTVPATLEEGGVVIPRSVMHSKDPAKAAAKFVAAHLAKKGHLPKKGSK